MDMRLPNGDREKQIHEQIFCAWPCLATLKYVKELPDANDSEYYGEYLLHWTTEGDALFKKRCVVVVHETEERYFKVRWLYFHYEWSFIELRPRHD